MRTNSAGAWALSLVTCVGALSISATAAADDANILNVQARLEGTAGATVTVDVALYDEAMGSHAPLFTETHPGVVIDANRLVAIPVGAQTPGGVPSDLAGSQTPLWFALTVDGALLGDRVRVGATAWALGAENAEKLGGRPADEYALKSAGGELGNVRYNATRAGLEYFDGASWLPVPPVALDPRAFRFYRLDVTGANGGGFSDDDVVVLELDLEWDGVFQPAAMTSCTEGAIGGIPATVTPAAGDGDCSPTGPWKAWMAFDDSISHGSGWLAYGLPAELTIELQRRVRLTRYRIQAGTCTAQGAPSAWTLEGSNDGTTWTLLDARSGQTGWNYSVDCAGTGEARTFSVP